MTMASSQVTARVLTDNGGATTLISFLSLPTAGRGVTVRYTNAVAANPIADPTMADNQGVGNSYVKAISATESGAGQMAGIWRCDSIGATSGTFTLTITHAASTGNYSLVGMQEVNQAITLDKTASSTTTVSGVTTVTTATGLSSADELVVAAYTEDSSRADSGLTCTVGYSSDMLEKDSNNHISASGNHKIVSSSSAVSAIYTVSTSGLTDAVAVVATFKAASSTSDADISGSATGVVTMSAAATVDAAISGASTAVLTGDAAATVDTNWTGASVGVLTGDAAQTIDAAISSTATAALTGDAAVTVDANWSSAASGSGTFEGVSVSSSDGDISGTATATGTFGSENFVDAGVSITASASLRMVNGTTTTARRLGAKPKRDEWLEYLRRQDDELLGMVQQLLPIIAQQRVSVRPQTRH